MPQREVIWTKEEVELARAQVKNYALVVIHPISLRPGVTKTFAFHLHFASFTFYNQILHVQESERAVARLLSKLSHCLC